MSKESVNIHVNNYCRLRDKQYAVYTEYAKKYGLTTKELFILEYVERIIPPAAQAENDAMAELSGEQQAELVRLTDLFSEQMRLKFQSINKNTL